MPKLYKTDIASSADLKVFVTDIRSEADLVVYETTEPSRRFLMSWPSA